MKRIAIESRLSGDYAGNTAFAQKVCLWFIRHGQSPLAMHLFYPQFLNDLTPAERTAGIECGLAWYRDADEHWFCFKEGDIVLSGGMQLALERRQKEEWGSRLVFALFTPDGAFVKELSAATFLTAI